jgi:hypothetical protein
VDVVVVLDVTPFNMNVQHVRLLDVFVIAPFLMYAGSRKELPNNIRLGLWAVGIGTLVYNGYNYLKNDK